MNSFSDTACKKQICRTPILLLLFVTILMVFSGITTAQYAGGDGTESNPYLISNVSELRDIESEPDAHYELVSDIELVPNYEEGELGWQPITEFTGTLDGNGHKLTNLQINRNASNQGLFAKIGEGATIKNLTIDKINMKTGSKTGALAGETTGAEITNIKIKNAQYNIYIGEYSGETISRAYIYYGQESIGGLIGSSNNTEIIDCAATNITMMNNTEFPSNKLVFSRRLGGLVGLANSGTITGADINDLVIKGTETSNHAISFTGGLIGEIANEKNEEMMVSECEGTNIDLTIGAPNLYDPTPGRIDQSRSGGLIGVINAPSTDLEMNGDITIEKSSVNGTITKGSAPAYNCSLGVGGFVGNAHGNKTKSINVTINDCHADVEIGNMFGEKRYLDVLLKHASNYGGVGGFAGLLNSTEVSDCSATGKLKESVVWAGGFVGTAEKTTIKTSYAETNITGTSVAGFAFNIKENMEISECYATGNVKSGELHDSGGFAVVVNGSIVNCYSTGNVEHHYVYVGGFAGQIKSGGVIKNCYTTGNTTLDYERGFSVGGFSAGAGGVLQDSIAFGSKTSQAGSSYPESINRVVANLNDGILSNNYAYEDMLVTYGGTEKTGVSNSSSVWGANMTKEEFADESFYTNPDNWNNTWDFDKVWEIKPGDGRPTLQNVPGDSLITGKGTKDNPYKIENWVQLDVVRDDLNAHYKLVSDLNASTKGYDSVASSSANGGQGFNPIGNSTNKFNGTFDGDGYSIADLTIDLTTEEQNNSCIALFGVIGNSGKLKEVNLQDASVAGDEKVGILVGRNEGTVVSASSVGSLVKGDTHVGGLVGENLGTITDSIATGDITGNSVTGGLVGANGVESRGYPGGYIRDSNASCEVKNGTFEGAAFQKFGGLVGQNYKGTITTSNASGNVNCGEGTVGDYTGGLVGYSNNTGTDLVINRSYATDEVDGGDYVGGLIGLNIETRIYQTYATGNVTGNKTVGGLVGNVTGSNGEVSRSYATGNVTGNSAVGGLIGGLKDATVSKAYWNIDTTGQSYSAGGTGLNTSDMKGEAAITNMEFDFTYSWKVDTGSNPSYPYLRNIIPPKREKDTGEPETEDDSVRVSVGESMPDENVRSTGSKQNVVSAGKTTE
ncbi:GLUG motif-containing protein, partial [Methanohalobium sp.]|uniref:GLUG motif-containing protein n=1 Tax=Methanohalobium sp. TaxID=2837493 RepID=UPI0025DA867F